MTMVNRLEINPLAKRFLKKIKEKSLQRKFREAIKNIQAAPFDAGELKKGDLSGIYGYDIYHNGTNYEIAYLIRKDKDGNLVIIILAGKRESFYQQLKRYLKTSR